MRLAARRYRNTIRRVRRLLDAEEAFRLTWDDYLAARRALRYFRTQRDEERANEYRQITEELATEIRAYLR